MFIICWNGMARRRRRPQHFPLYLAPRELGAIVSTARPAFRVTADVASLHAEQAIAAKAFKRTCWFLNDVGYHDTSGGAVARDRAWKESSRAV